MGIFKRRKTENKIYLSGSGASLSSLGRTSESDALSNSAFWACVVNLSRIYAHLPLHAYTKEDGAPKEIDGDRLISRLLRNPCPYMTAYQWKFIMGFNFELHGQAVALIERDSRGMFPIALIPVNPASVVGFWKNNELRFMVNDREYAYDDVLIIHNTPSSFDSVLSPIYYASDDMDLERQCKSVQRDYYKGGSVIGRKIGVPPGFSDQQRDELRSIFNSSSGFKNLVLDNRISVDLMQMPAGDMAKLTEAQKWKKSEVATRFNVPPFLIGDSSVTYANAEQQGIQMVVYCLQPRIKAWEDALLRICQPGQYVKFSLSGLMRGDHAARASFYQTMIMNGSMSINEVRALEELPPIKNGDAHFFPMNYATVDDIVSGKATQRAPSMWDLPVDDEENTEKKKTERKPLDEKRLHERAFIEESKAPAKSYRNKLEGLIRKQLKVEIEKIKTLVATDLPADFVISEFEAWLAENAKEYLPQYQQIFIDILKRMVPVVKKELDSDLDVGDEKVEGYATTYASGLVSRHCAKVARECSVYIDSTDFDTECDALISDMPIEDAEEEVNRSSNAFSVFLYSSFGLEYMHVVASPDACPFCSKIDGRVVSVNGYVLKKNEDEDDGDGGVRHIRKNYRHPPFHTHCACHVAPGK